jgi:glyoxylase-like metal-dependent hydrolase (beta-lactamase superfamily II)
MPAFICNTCGTQYEPSAQPPASCAICQDERQYVPPAGQSWTTLDQLAQRHMNGIRELEPRLISLLTFPHFGIGQRALLVRTPDGNILWDCMALVDQATIEMVNAMGGLKCIAISHPHYYTTMVEWSKAFGGVPIYVHEADRRWIMRDGPTISLWGGQTKELLPGLTLICAGGHYPGGTVLHWAGGAGGKGALLSGDIVQVVQDNKSVSFMWSFPNFIPLSGPRVQGLVNSLKAYQFDRIHGAFLDRTIWADGKSVMERSAARYLKIIGGDGTYETGDGTYLF